MRQQRGFTLLELLVAMAIFAMLAVAGWQVFDGVTRARDRAQLHADNLAVLQYAYLQLQQDMRQIAPYQASNDTEMVMSNNVVSDSSQAETAVVNPEPFMSLNEDSLSFVRFADPDPRYQSSDSLQRIEYVFADERLVRRQYTSINGGSESVSLDSVLLEGVTAGSWQAYLPEVSDQFPGADISAVNSSTPQNSQANAESTESEIVLLPKGLAIGFTYQDMPITWQWALAPQPMSPASQTVTDNENNDGGDSDNGSI